MCSAPRGGSLCGTYTTADVSQCLALWLRVVVWDRVGKLTLREEVPLGDKDCDDRRGLDVLFERIDGLQIVHVQKD